MLHYCHNILELLHNVVKKYLYLGKMGLNEIKHNGWKRFFYKVKFYFFNPYNVFMEIDRWKKAKEKGVTIGANSGRNDEEIEEIKGLVSVVIPIYDRVQELKESIDSIINQTYKNYEILLVTDGSPKDTYQVVESYRNRPNVRIFHYYNNTGNAGRGKNKGIKEARGEYIAFQDSDDLAAPDRLKWSVECLERYGADVVYGGWRARLDGTRKDTGLKDGQEIFSPDCDLPLLVKKCVPCQSTVMARKRALMEVGGFKRRMQYREDHELWVRLAYYGYQFKAIPQILTDLRIHQGNNELKFKKHDRDWYSLLLEEFPRKTRLPLKIAYLIPSMTIGGGVAVILQHANRLLEKGHDVFIISQDFNAPSDWFPNNNVAIISLNKKFEYLFEGIDILIGTGWTTAPVMDVMTAKRKIYFIQSDERRFHDDQKIKEVINETYKIDCEYMTIAKWMQRWLKDEFEHDAYYVPNGLDTSIFHQVPPLEPKGNKIRVLLEGPIKTAFKGMADAFEVVKELDCEVWVVSGSGKPEKGWRYDRFFEKVPMGEMKKIYSSCDILLKMSRVEGSPLPPLEMMACGGVPVIRQVTGIEEYAVDGVNCIIVKDKREAREAVNNLIGDDHLRAKLIKNGLETATKRSWDQSIEMLEDILNQHPTKTY